jgi:hypothetical protein
VDTGWGRQRLVILGLDLLQEPTRAIGLTTNGRLWYTILGSWDVKFRDVEVEGRAGEGGTFREVATC